MAVAHYLEALDCRRNGQDPPIFGGKNPHPNWPGGRRALPINIDDAARAGAINMERLNPSRRASPRQRVLSSVYLPDLLAIGGCTNRGWLYGGGLALLNVMDSATASTQGQLTTRAPTSCPAVPSSTATGQDPSGRSARPRAGAGVRHPLLVQVRRRDQGPAPWDGVTEPNYALGPRPQGHAHPSSARRERQVLLAQGPRWRGHAWRWAAARRAYGARATCQRAKEYPGSASMVDSVHPRRWACR